MLYPVNLPLSPFFSTINVAQVDVLDFLLCCSTIEAPCLITRGTCVCSVAFWHAPNYYIIPGRLTYPLQCVKQVVLPRAEGSRSGTDGSSVNSCGEGDSLGSIYSSKLTGVKLMLQIVLMC